MNKYLAMALCFIFLWVNPVEAAVANSPGDEKQVESCLVLAAGKNVLGSTKDTRGKVNPKSFKKEAKNQGKRDESNQCSPGDLDLLARLVHAEAKGEPYLGKIAVAATVLNRVGNPDYPSTIPEVIYEYNHGFQYCPVRNGEINFSADGQAFKAVKEALAGKDPTGGALSFFNPSQTMNTWIRNRPYLTTIGNHVFVK